MSISIDSSRAPDPRLLRPLRQVALAGVAMVLVWPAARGDSHWLGWLPLWLVGMPWLAWWSLYRFRLPRLPHLRLPSRRRRQALPRGRVATRRRAHPDLRQGGTAGRLC